MTVIHQVWFYKLESFAWLALTWYLSCCEVLSFHLEALSTIVTNRFGCVVCLLVLSLVGLWAVRTLMQRIAACSNKRTKEIGSGLGTDQHDHVLWILSSWQQYLKIGAQEIDLVPYLVVTAGWIEFTLSLHYLGEPFMVSHQCQAARWRVPDPPSCSNRNIVVLICVQCYN